MLVTVVITIRTMVFVSCDLYYDEIWERGNLSNELKFFFLFYVSQLIGVFCDVPENSSAFRIPVSFLLFQEPALFQ